MASVTFDGTVFHALEGGVTADCPYAVRIQVEKPLTDDQANQLAALVGYAYAKTGGERGNGFTQDTPTSIIYWCDTTKGRAYQKLDTFFEDASVMIVEGSPPRKTKGGTRLVEGLGDVGKVTFFADSVFGATEAEPEPPTTMTEPQRTDDGYDSRGFNEEGVHRNGTLLDADGCDVTGERFGSNSTDLDPNEDRVARTKNNEVVKFKFRNGKPVSVQKLATNPDGTVKWEPPRTTSVGAGLATLQGVMSINAGARAVPEKVAANYGKSTGTCLTCGRHLSSKASIAAGFGPECKSKLYGN